MRKLKILIVGLVVLITGSLQAQTSQTINYGDLGQINGSGSWTCPANVTSVTVECWGAGGAGGSAQATSTSFQSRGGGGAGGSYSKITFTDLTPGASYTYTVGGGGAGATANSFVNLSYGASGGSTIFTGTSVVTAQGGPGGQNIYNATALGLGGTAYSNGNTSGGINNYGGNGALAVNASGGGAGGGGSAGAGTGASGTGNGGNALSGTGGAAGAGGGVVGATGSNTNAPGAAGAAPGAGGSGGTNRSVIDTKVGGAGGAGKIVINWITNVAVAPTITFPSATITKNYGDANITTQTATSNSGGVITYSTNNTGVASVNTSTGEVTLGNVGTATITANQVAATGYLAGSATYSITVNAVITTGTLNNGALTYEAGFGPSAEANFTVSGSGLVADVTVTCPSNFEVSTTSGAGFGATATLTQSGGALAGGATVYTRIKAGLAPNAGISPANRTITLTSGAITKTVQLTSATVPGISNTVTAGSTISYSGAGPSAEKTLTLNGQLLAGATLVVVTPGSNMEISSTSGSGFASTAISIPVSANAIQNNSLIYARLKAGLTAGTYSDATTKVTASVTGASFTSKEIQFTATVTATTTVSAPSSSNLTYEAGFGPSAESSFTVAGTALVTDITITTGSNLEISTTSGSGFVGSTGSITLTKNGSGTVATTTIYTRLKAGLSPGNTSANGARTVTIGNVEAGNKTVLFTYTITGIAVSTPTNTATYVYNAGPSVEKTFNVQGANLGAATEVIVTPGSNMEISLTSPTAAIPSAFVATNTIPIAVTAGAITTTPIYARLKAGLASGTYTDASTKVTASVTGASFTSKEVQFTGTVSPSTTVSTPSNLDLTYEAGAGPSAESNFSVSGAGLLSDITLTPGLNLEISTTSGSGFVGSTGSITLTKDGSGTVATTTIHVRLKAGLNPGSSGANSARTVTIGNVEAGNKTEVFTGTVTGIAVSTPTNTVTYVYNAGPSVDKTFNVQGANLGAATEVVVTPGSNMEISLTSPTAAIPSAFVAANTIPIVVNAGAITTTPIYARLKAGLASGTYTDATTKVTASVTGASFISKEVQFTATVSAIAPTVTVTPIGTYTFNGSTQGPNAATNTGTGTSYTFSYVGTGATTYEASSTAPTVAGTYTVTATVTAHGNYASASSAATAFSIDKASSSITATGTTTFTANGSPQGPAAADVTGSTGAKSYSYSGTGSTSYGPSATAPSAAGTYEMSASVAADANYYGASSSALAFTINAPSTINLTGSKTSADLTSSTADVTVSGTSTVLTVDNSKTVKNLTLGDGALIKLSGSNTLTVSQNLDLKADLSGSFSLNLGSSAVSVTGSARYLKTIDDTKWYFIAFPFDVPVAGIMKSNNTTMGKLGNPGGAWFIKSYDGNNRALQGTGPSIVNWVSMTSPDYTLEPNTFKLTANQGYIIGIAGNTGATVEIAFPINKSVLSNETLDARTKVGVTAYTGANANDNGWNLIGQPYLSKFKGSDAAVNYMLFSNGTSTYTTYSTFDHTLDSKIIDPFSAYFVQAGSTTNISFATTGRQSVRSNVTQSVSPIVQLNMTTATGTDNTTLILDDQQSTAYQIGQDMEKWIGTGTDKPQLYSTLGNVNYAFNALPLSSVNNLPLGFYTKTAGTSTIHVDATQVKDLSELLLTDKETGATTNLLQTDYSFTATAGTTTNRLVLNARKVTTDKPEINNHEGEPQVIINNSKILINNLTSNATVRVYDMVGHLIYNQNPTSTTIEVPVKVAGVYSIQLQTPNRTWTQKVVVK